MTPAKNERAAIVKWLREHSWECEKHAHRCKADKAFPHANAFAGMATNYSGLAAAIERGDHLAPQEGEG